MPYLFSYGTLQLVTVQIETFGRKLHGKIDSLAGYEIKMLEITDAEVLRKSNQKFHPIIEYTGDLSSKVEGVLFEVTENEILQADTYEVEQYQRVEAVFDSGLVGYIYIKKD